MTKQDRRTFIGTSLLALGATNTFAAAPANAPLIHHVFFWLKNPSSNADLEKLLEGIRSLKKIDAIQELRIGKPAKTPKRPVLDDSYSVSLFVTFNDVAGHDTYQEHPIHKKFAEGYANLWSKVQVYDSMDI